MNDSLLSVIVPVYNVENYLKRCVDSIIGQTYKNLEILLIDDGSTDSSGILCDEIAKSDQRIRVIHKQNGGLSDARNAGIDAAKGEYISFIDSDDFIDTDMLELLYRNIVNDEADIAVCGIYDYYDKQQPKVFENIEHKVLSCKEAIYMILDSRIISVNAVNKLYKKELFKGDLRFRKGKIAEDAFIAVDLFKRAHRISYTSEQKYYYWHRPNSITTLKFNPEKDFSPVEAYDYNYGLVCEIDKAYLEPVARMRCCWSRFLVLDKMIAAQSDNLPQAKEYIDFLKKNRKFILLNPVFTKSRKIAFFILCFSYPLYKVFVRLQAGKLKKQLNK